MDAHPHPYDWAVQFVGAAPGSLPARGARRSTGLPGYFEAICNNATSAFFVTDERHHCIYMNPAAERMTGFTIEEIKGRSLHDVIHSLRLGGGQHPITGEDVFIHKDGHSCPVTFTVSPVRDGDRCTGTVIEMRDLTTTWESHRLRAAADHERRLLDLFVEHAPAGLALFDSRMRYLAASRRWRVDYKLPAEIVGQSHYELIPEIPEQWKEVHRRALAGEVLSADEDRFERVDGSVQWVRWETRPWYDGAGAIGGIIIAAEEVTEHHRAREAVEAAREEAERANRAKDEFLAMLGHELRNPLAPIMTALHLMRLRAGDDCYPRERGIIERQANHMLRLVEDLLDVSRITRGKVRLVREPIELSKVVAKSLEMTSPLFESAKHHLHVDVPPEGLIVDADPGRLSQVVSNLLTNAAKYTPEGGRVEVTVRREDAHVVLRVSDSGTGIPPELLPDLFERFVQGRQGLDRSRGGLGLGLAIVKSFVEMHGGTVRAESPGAGRGSIFTVTLPLLAHPTEPKTSNERAGEEM